MLPVLYSYLITILLIYVYTTHYVYIHLFLCAYTYTGNNEYTPLIYTCVSYSSEENLPIIKMLLDYGADGNAVDADGR